MKIIMLAAGSHGDVLPFVALGKEIKQRGHDVHIVSAANFESIVREAGLGFSGVGSPEVLTAALNHPAVVDPMMGMHVISHAVKHWTMPGYEALEPGRTVLVGSSLALATRLLSETHRVPCATVHLSPSLFRSNYLMPSSGPWGHLEHFPRFIKSWLWKSMDQRFFDPLFTAPFNELRAELKLPPVDHVFGPWLHAAELTLGMFPEWFAPRQPDWPSNLVQTDFPLYDHGSDAGLPADVQAFLDAGEAPVAFTAGTANAVSHAFYAESAQACQLLGRRGILLSQSAHQLPANLPPGVAHFSYVPFKALLPRLAAFVHHGGIGTTSLAMLAGVPQLIRPMAFDQFDNASRAMRLGVASQLYTQHYTAQTAAHSLRTLISNPQVKQRCQQVARQVANTDGLQAACDAILRLNPAG